MALQRTRRPRFRSGRSLRSLGSPLNARSLGRTSMGRSPNPRTLAGRMGIPRWVLLVAIAFGVVELTNIALEQFVGLAEPWNAIVPATAMGLIVLTSAVVAVRASVIAAVITIEGGMLFASVGALLWVTLHRQAELRLTLMNAAMHLTFLPFVAAIAGGGAIVVSRVAGGRRFVSAAGVPLLVAGALLLVHMSGLPRPERPPWVMSGFGLCAIGLVLLPCAAAPSESRRGADVRPN